MAEKSRPLAASGATPPEGPVLVVEDDSDVREALLAAVEGCGYLGIDASDGHVALKGLDAAFVLPSLLVVDLNRPEMDGATFARAVRADARLADIPIVVLSGDANVERRIEDIGARAWLRKPVDLHAFRRVLHRYAGPCVGQKRDGKPLVLLVEDDADVRELTAEYMRACDLDVTVTEDGAGAWLKSAGTKPCIVVLDLLMPVMDGNALYQAMQSDPELAGAAVVISTSDPSRAPSGVLIIKKPVNRDALLNAVRQCC